MVKTRSMIKNERSLPDEIISEIFVRLPVKSLCRFKCVSKSILSMIEHDSSFVEKTRLKPPFLWQFDHGDDIHVYSFDAEGITTHVKTFECSDKYRYVSSCNGLTCYYDEGRSFRFRLCNLTTMECMDFLGMYKDLELCFDPLSKKYKVLASWVGLGGICDFEILTLGKDPSWRPVKNTLELNILPKSETTVNERLFWSYLNEEQIVSFNIADEEFGLIDIPELAKKTFECTLLEFEGSLVLVEQPIDELPTFNSWMLKDIGRSNRWIKMKNITVPFEGSSLRRGSSIFRYGWTADFLSQSGEIIVPVFNDEGRYLFVYSFLNGQFKMMKITMPALYFIPRKYVENHVGLEELVFHH